MNIVSNAKQFLVGTFWHSNPVWSKIATIFLGFVVVVLSCVIALQAINSSDPDAQPGFVGLDSSSDIPDLYTGELVDLDKDGTPDVALFGSPEGPTIVTQVGDANPWTQSTVFQLRFFHWHNRCCSGWGCRRQISRAGQQKHS